MATGGSSVPLESGEREIHEDSGEEDVEGWADWEADADDGEQEDAEDCICLFCDEIFTSAASVFAHCQAKHSFDFLKFRREQRLGFYDCLRLINYIRSQVADRVSPEVLIEDLKAVRASAKLECTEDDQLRGSPWSGDKYLTPYLPNDPLLYSFDDSEDEDIDDLDAAVKMTTTFEGKRGQMENSDTSNGSSAAELSESLRELMLTTDPEITAHATAILAEEISKGAEFRVEDEADDDIGDRVLWETPPETSGSSTAEDDGTSGTQGGGQLKKKKTYKVTFASVAEKEKLNINRSYFGSYSGFGIHREMLGDKVRTETYQAALMENPSLIKDAVVMDIGCGTGILSLFAAKAGASKVISVDGSEKMTAVATQVARANGLLDENISNEERTGRTGAITVVAGMIEELNSSMPVPERSVDVLVSEWMGYCLLFESMLGSVLYARDKWLKPGGAMLPDTATMYVAGFGKGGTSLSFWEDVYGFDMSTVGEEVLHDATKHPIIDVIAAKDVITDTCLLKEFDLLSMKHDDVDYTADFNVKLPPKGEHETGAVVPAEDDRLSKPVWCYGLVVWFDTGFTSRFCKEKPVNLSTSPHLPKTHWAQTLLTFREPVALGQEETMLEGNRSDRDEVGTEKLPAYKIGGRISIARSYRYRSIDISLETSAFGAGGAVKSWPVQMFDI
ncbi:hypothetical protein R1sor_018106 [Riccia sorocarpa]|uniref:C2H2-type domain-containing protein n=1 Tax=Riccia sorocarpa TaxID=122646 RepID=A0ABD3IEZ5_9MARC